MNDESEYWINLILWTPAVLCVVAIGELFVQMVTR